MANGEHRILLVDDDPDVLDILGDFIAVFGFEYETAEDGLEAIEKMKHGAFNIVLTDMMMPNMDGMELLRHIHNNYPETKVMVVTGYDRTFTYTDVINAGASDFISKPFNPDELEAKINRIIREIELMRQLEHLSISDGLTGLYNRRHFDNKIIEEARYIPDEDFGMVFAITLSDENVMFVLGDDEGNHAGSLSFNDGSCLPTL